MLLRGSDALESQMAHSEKDDYNRYFNDYYNAYETDWNRLNRGGISQGYQAVVPLASANEPFRGLSDNEVGTSFMQPILRRISHILGDDVMDTLNTETTYRAMDPLWHPRLNPRAGVIDHRSDQQKAKYDELTEYDWDEDLKQWNDAKTAEWLKANPKYPLRDILPPQVKNWGLTQKDLLEERKPIVEGMKALSVNIGSFEESSSPNSELREYGVNVADTAIHEAFHRWDTLHNRVGTRDIHTTYGRNVRPEWEEAFSKVVKNWTAFAKELFSIEVHKLGGVDLESEDELEKRKLAVLEELIKKLNEFKGGNSFDPTDTGVDKDTGKPLGDMTRNFQEQAAGIAGVAYTLSPDNPLGFIKKWMPGLARFYEGFFRKDPFGLRDTHQLTVLEGDDPDTDDEVTDLRSHDYAVNERIQFEQDRMRGIQHQAEINTIYPV